MSPDLSSSLAAPSPVPASSAPGRDRARLPGLARPREPHLLCWGDGPSQGPAAISTGRCPTEGALPATAHVPLWDSGRWRGSPRMMKGLAAHSGLSLSRTPPPPAHPGLATPASRGAVCAELGHDAAVGGAVQDRRPHAPDVHGRFAPRAPDMEEKSGRGFCSELGLERRALGAQASRAPPPSWGSLAVGAGNPHTHDPGAGGTRHRPHPWPNVL